MALPRVGLLLGLIALRAGRVEGIVPCSPIADAFTVASTEDAQALASALNCSGGVFDVRWEGAVIVDEPIAVLAGSVLSIVGVGVAHAIADGNDTTRLFIVDGASLDVTGLQFVNGVYSSGSPYYGGGAINALDSVVTLHDTSFKRNYAFSGGAVIATNSNVTLSGETLFEGNNAGYGGAVWSEGSEAVLSWSGKMCFTNNEANELGGAVLARGGAAFWSGDTSFEYNSGSYSGGGALVAESSVNVSWSGETRFRGNFGGVTGGAIYSSGSRISGSGNTTFTDNVSDGNGGAWFASGSNIVLEGETSFTNNTGDEGGAVVLYSGSLSWAGVTHFIGNTALLGGGALAAGSGCTVSCGGLTTFHNNTATQLGGAISISAETESTMVFVGDSNTSFNRNQAGTNGGAIALSGPCSLDFEASSSEVSTTTESPGLSFGRNLAGTAGGAVYQSGIAHGVTWTGVSFVSNSAQIGGAVYSLASGTLVEGEKRSSEFPTTYVEVIFQDNSAVGSGGAVESAAGRDVFQSTLFEGNSAGLGGAVRLAGFADLIDCDFLGNNVTEAGPAVANVGIIRDVVNTSFAKHALLCDSGAFLNYTEGDPYADVCTGCPPCLAGCVVDSAGPMECTPQLDYSESAGAGVILETLAIKGGYWRATNTSTTILPCYNEGACIGGVTGSSGFCRQGYSGPYCSICSSGYAMTLMYTCSECSSGNLVFGVIGSIVALMLLAAVAVYLTRKVGDDSATSQTQGRNVRASFQRLSQLLPLHALKIIVVAWQILTQFDSVANVTYPGVYGRFLDGISAIVGFDLGFVFASGCIFDMDFHQRMLTSTLGPLFALVLLGATYGVGVLRNRRSTDALERVRHKHASMALLISFLVYSSVSSTVFRMFACEGLDDGKEYLKADYTIECDTGKHRALQVYAAFMILVYPVGIPAVYAFLLYSNREVLKDGSRRGDVGSVDLQLTSDLWKPYTPECYYYEVVECARRVALTGVIVFIFPNSAAQIAVTLLFSFAFLIFFEVLTPYASSSDLWLSRVGYVVVFLSMFQALLLKVDVSNENSDSQEVFGGVLLAANMFMVAGVVAEAIMITRFFVQNGGSDVLEDTKPKMRSSSSIGYGQEGFGTNDGPGNDTRFA